jgi:4-methyl-5(b-hydroxyethyl)-thiazole monophosphate biosynthesis
MKRVLMPLAPGFEEIEALTVVDILRRAGAEVVMAGTIDGPVEGRSRIRVIPDTPLDDVESGGFDMVVLPGGAPGTENLKKDARVGRLVKELYGDNRLVTAICAAPTVLSALGLTDGKKVTSHPSVREALKNSLVLDDRVVVDGLLITSQGPGTALEFAFALVTALFGAGKAAEVNKSVLARL